MTPPPTFARPATVLATAAALGLCSVARAAPPEKTAAELLDAEGTALLQEHRYAEACPKLAESERLEPGTGVLLRLGLCDEQLGKTATAWAAFREAAARAQRTGDEALRQLATKRADGIASRVPRVVLVAPRGAENGPIDVTCDGAHLDRAALGVELPLDPGTHTVEAQSPGRERFRARFTLAAREGLVTVPLDLPTSASNAVASSSGSGQRTTAVVLGGVGIAGLVVGSVLGFSAMSNWNRAHGECTSGVTGCSPDALNLQSTVNTEATGSTLAFAASGAVLVGAAILWWTAPRQEPEGGHVGCTVVPVLGIERLGLDLTGRF